MNHFEASDAEPSPEPSPAAEGEQSIEEAFYFCPRCATKNPQPGAIPFRCPECGLAQFFGPVAAVGALIVDHADRLLLVRRARDPGKGRWGLPGGFVDRGETVEEALQREVHEETRLELSEYRLLFTYPNRYVYRGVAAPVIDLFYLCRVDSPDLLRLAPEELESARWVHPTLEYLNKMAFASNRRAIEHWLGDMPDSSSTV